MPTGNIPIYPQPGNRRPVLPPMDVPAGADLFVIGANAFLNAGTVHAGDTVTGVSLTSHALVVGNGTVPPLALGPGASGNLVVSNGTDWVSSATIGPAPILEFGGGSAAFGPMGLASNQLNNAGIGNGADTSDDVLFTYTLAANSLNANGKAIEIETHGAFAGNGNDKRIQLFWNAFSYFSSGTLTDNGTKWSLHVSLNRYAANNQLGEAIFIHGNAVSVTPIFGSITDSSNITIAVTGASPTTGAANDVVSYRMAVKGLN